MNVVAQICEYFLLSLAFGVGVCAPLASTRLTGAGFMKVLNGVTMGAVVLAGLVHFYLFGLADPSLFYFPAAFLPMGLAYLFHRDDKSLPMWALYVLQNVFLLIIFHRLVQGSWDDLFFLLSSSLLTGSITYAMVLGHWYLVVPKLSETPLKRAVAMTWMVLAIKLVWAALVVLQGPDFLDPQTMMGMGYSFNWMMVAMRFGWGYLIIGVMSFFAWRLVAMRSIQSATGLLYVMTFFVFIGELVSLYLYADHGAFL